MQAKRSFLFFFLGLVAGIAGLAVPHAMYRTSPSVIFKNPLGIFRSAIFSEIAITKSRRTVYLSGQTARDGDGGVVGVGDLRAQTEKVFQNMKIAIEATGGNMADIAKLTIYIVHYKPEDRLLVGSIIQKSFPTPPANTLVGVSSLAIPELLIEVDAIAAGN